jgi:replicative DNA helicase
MTVSLTAIQENLITLLTYDDKHCLIIRNVVDVELWGGPFKFIASRIYEYIDRYKKAPKDHIADLMADKLETKNKREGNLYEDILLSIRDAYEGINAEYVMGQLEGFTTRQSLRTVAIDLAKALQRDTDESIAEAQEIIRTTNITAASVFDPGLRLSDKNRVLDFLDQQSTCFPTGIPELDKRGFGPTRKELWLYIAAAKRGKCIAEGELVLGADGSYRPIEKFTGSVPSLNEKTFKFETNKATLKPNGLKPTLKLTTRSGRSVCLTGNHPLLTPRGWVHAEKLIVGDTIAAPHHLPVFGKNVMPFELVRFLAHGLMGTKSRHKTIPDSIFTLRRAYVADFLRTIFSCDGSIYDSKTGPAFEYGSTSETMIRQLDHLLTRFGIVGRIRKREQLVNGCPYLSWNLTISGKKQVGLLNAEIGLLCNKGKKLENLVAKYQGTLSRDSHIHGERLGDIYWDEVKSIEDNGVLQTYDLAVENNHNFIAGNIVVHNTWMLIQLAKMAMVHRLRVCHISLEMSEDRSAQRYMQALFAMSKRKEKQIITKFTRDQLGRLTGFDDAEVSPRLFMNDPKIRDKLERRIDKFGTKLENVFIKDFPTGQLTVGQLEAYLDGLENTERFTPDLLIVDYPDLMKLDKNNFRLAIDETYKNLRGLGVARNMAVAVVSQSHRAAANAKHVKSDNVAEAYSKVAHADCVITYNQTDAERRMHLARLYVSGGRNDEDKITIVVSQNYAFGMFAVDSVLMSGANYWQNLPHGADEADES